MDELVIGCAMGARAETADIGRDHGAEADLALVRLTSYRFLRQGRTPSGRNAKPARYGASSSRRCSFLSTCVGPRPSASRDALTSSTKCPASTATPPLVAASCSMYAELSGSGR